MTAAFVPRPARALRRKLLDLSGSTAARAGGQRPKRGAQQQTRETAWLAALDLPKERGGAWRFGERGSGVLPLGADLIPAFRYVPAHPGLDCLRGR